MSGAQHAAAQPLQLDPNQHSGGVGEYLLHRAKPYLPPWLLAGGVGILSLPANWAWGGSAAASAGLTLASVGLTAATWWLGKATTQQRRLHSAMSIPCNRGVLRYAASAS